MAGTQIPLFTGPQDPSQLDALLNQVIVGCNGYFDGSTPEVVLVTKGTTSGALPSAGAVTINSTTRTAGTTGRYTLTAPTAAQIGQSVSLTSLSTVKATITSLYERNKTKISMISTAALSAGVKLPSVILTALTTSSWGVIAGYGNVAST